MPSSKSFSASVSRWRQATAERVDEAVLKIARELFREIIYKTPVLEGWLVNNWQTAINYYDSSLSSRPSPNKSGPIRRMEATLKKGVFFEKDAFVSMTNATRYAFKIEYEGWSKYKAPEGMVRISLINIANKYK